METENRKSILIIICSVIAVGIGEILLKYGLVKLGALNFSSNAVQSFIAIFTSPYIITGIVLFGMSSVLWLIVLSKTELSYAYPLLGMGYAVVALLSWIFFNESLTGLRIIGIGVITLGIVMMSRS